MANLIVRNVDEAVVRALKAQAGLHGVSAEAEHRTILEQAFSRPERRSFSEVLSQMPDVGSDADFERQDEESIDHVFD